MAPQKWFPSFKLSLPASILDASFMKAENNGTINTFSKQNLASGIMTGSKFFSTKYCANI